MIADMTTLGSVITIKKGLYITKKEAKEGPYPVILGGQEPAYFIDRYNHTGKAIVISRSGASAGFVSRWNEPIFVTDGFLIEPKQGIDFDFLYYLLKYHQPQLQGLQGGAAIPHVNPRIINAIEILLPNLQKQKQIAAIITVYDELIENNKKQIKLLEEAAQRLYKEWFVDLRFPGYENTPIVDGVPEGWSRYTVTDLLEIKYGKDHKAREDGLIPVYGSGGVMRRVDTVLHSGESVLIPRKGSLNNILYVTGDFWTIDTMFYSIPKRPNTVKYTYLFLTQLDMYSFNIGAAVPSMTVKILDGITIIVPPMDLLEVFERIVSPLLLKKKMLEREYLAAEKMRDRLLPKLIGGEIEI
jgi:type I restriction enzyme S subunit